MYNEFNYRTIRVLVPPNDADVRQRIRYQITTQLKTKLKSMPTTPTLRPRIMERQTKVRRKRLIIQMNLIMTRSQPNSRITLKRSHQKKWTPTVQTLTNKRKVYQQMITNLILYQPIPHNLCRS